MKNYWQFISEDIDEDEEVQEDEVQEETDEEIEDNFRQYLKNLDTKELFDYYLIDKSNIYDYVDDDAYLKDILPDLADNYTSDFIHTVSEENIKDYILRSYEYADYRLHDEVLNDIREKAVERAADETDDLEELEWITDYVIQKEGMPDLLDRLNMDDLVELCERYGIKYDIALEKVEDQYKSAKDYIGDICADFDCIFTHVENYIDEEQIIDDIVDSMDIYTMKDYL